MKLGLFFASSVALCPSSAAFQQAHFNNIQNVLTKSSSRIPLASRHMQPSSIENEEVKALSRRFGTEKSFKSDKRVPRTELLAATIDSVETIDASILGRLGNIQSLGQNTIDIDAASKVFSASLLITGNTVGSSMFVLPDAVGGVGMLSGSAIFFGKRD